MWGGWEGGIGVQYFADVGVWVEIVNASIFFNERDGAISDRGKGLHNNGVELVTVLHDELVDVLQDCHFLFNLQVLLCVFSRQESCKDSQVVML